ncbi:MAG: hypothetical protein ABI416_06470 [Ginsengibacter sp.]
MDSAIDGLKELTVIYDTLTQQKDFYKANQVQIQIRAVKAWMLFKQGKNNEALDLMKVAAEMEDNTQKHPVTPGEVLPAMELLGDMLLQMNKPSQALEIYEIDLKKHPKRFNGLYGAGAAAERSNDLKKAQAYYRQLTGIANSAVSHRPEIDTAQLFLQKHDR